MCASADIFCAALYCLLRLFNCGVKTLHVRRIFHVAWSFFPHECVFLRVLQDFNWMFFTASAKGFSHTCSDRTCRMKWLILPGDRPYCSLHFSPLFWLFRTLLYRAALSSRSVWVRWSGERDQRGLLELRLTLSIPGESGQCGLLTWTLGVRLHLSMLQQDTTDWGKSHNAQHSPLDF